MRKAAERSMEKRCCSSWRMGLWKRMKMSECQDWSVWKGEKVRVGCEAQIRLTRWCEWCEWSSFLSANQTVVSIVDGGGCQEGHGRAL